MTNFIIVASSAFVNLWVRENKKPGCHDPVFYKEEKRVSIVLTRVIVTHFS
jgi:hypothetical protein